MSVNMERAERRQNVRHFLYTFMNDCDTENAAEKTMGSKYVPKYIKYGLLGALKKNDSKAAYNKIAKLGMFIDNSCNELVYYNSLATSVVRWTVTMSIDSEQIRTVFERVISEVGQITDDDIRFILEKYKYQEERRQAGYGSSADDGIMSFLKPKSCNPATSLMRYYGSSLWMKLMRSILRNVVHIFTENTFTMHREEEQQQDDESTHLMDEFKSTRTNVITTSETSSKEKMSRLLESDNDSSGDELLQNRESRPLFKAGRPMNPPKNTTTCFDVEDDGDDDVMPNITNSYFSMEADENDDEQLSFEGSDTSKETVIENPNACANRISVESTSVENTELDKCYSTENTELDKCYSAPTDIQRDDSENIHFNAFIIKQNNIVSDYEQRFDDSKNIGPVVKTNPSNIVCDYEPQFDNFSNISPVVKTATTTKTHVHFDKNLKDYVFKQSKREAFESVQRFGPSTSSVCSRYMKKTYATTMNGAIAARRQMLQTRKRRKRNKRYYSSDRTNRPLLDFENSNHIPKLLAIEDTVRDINCSSIPAQNETQISDGTTNDATMIHFDWASIRSQNETTISDSARTDTDITHIDSASTQSQYETNVSDGATNDMSITHFDPYNVSTGFDSNVVDTIHVFVSSPESYSQETNAIDVYINSPESYSQDIDAIDVYVNSPKSDGLTLPLDTDTIRPIVSKPRVNSTRKYKHKNPIFDIQKFL